MRRSLDPSDRASLQAALSLLDDMDNDAEMDWIFGRDSPDDSGDADTTPPKKPTRKRQRNRRKDEILYLRNKVSELENELEVATQRIAEANGIAKKDVELLSIWEEFASRQQRKRRATEVENGKLRDMLERQVRVAKELMQFLEKQPREEDIPGLRALKRLQISPVDVRVFNHEDLLRRMDVLYEQAGGIFSSANEWTSRRNVRDVHVCDDDLDEIVVKIYSAWVVPFSLDAVARVVRERSERSSLETQCAYFETLEEQDRVLVSLFAGSTDEMGNCTIEVPGRLVTRHYPEPEDGSVVVVSELIVEPTISMMQHFLAYAVHSEGWTRISSYKPNGERLSSATTQHLTHIQSLRRVRIIPRSLPAHIQKQRTGVFSEVVLSHITEDLDESRQVIEDQLLLQDSADDAATTSRTSSECAASPPATTPAAAPEAPEDQHVRSTTPSSTLEARRDEMLDNVAV